MSNNVDKELIEVREIIKRLDVIIYLLLKKNQKEGVTTRNIIKDLSDIGLKDHEIAGILGKSRSYIASELTLLRKSRSSKGDKNDSRKQNLTE